MPIVSKDAYKRSLAKRVSLNKQILKNPYWLFPVEDFGHEDFMPVGRGDKSSSSCGVYRSLSVCDNIEGHRGKSLNGVDVTDKVIVRLNHLWCNKSSCSVCFIRGWSVNRARAIEGRLAEAVFRGLGKVEHVVVSPAVADRGLSESVLRKMCRKALKDRGIVGGCMIFHGFRLAKGRDVLVWSPHYHVLGFLEGGYGCRGCIKSCSGCSGFEARTRECFKKDGMIVRVLPERKTVFGTAWYQLNHASIRVGIKRFHCITWMGNCAKHMFKSPKVKAKIVCPCCDEEMVRSVHMGSRHIVKDIGHVDYVSIFADERLDENGELNYVPFGGGVG